MNREMKRIISIVVIVGLLIGLYSSSMDMKVYAASTTTMVPITCYTLSSTENATTYTAVNGSYSGYICPDDQCKITAMYDSGWVQVSYPTASGTKTAYAKSSDFFCNTNFSTSIIKAGKNIDVYKKANLSSALGTVYGTDDILVIGTSNGNTQILYPISGGYKLGFALGNPFSGTSDTTSGNSSGSAEELVEKAKSQLGIKERSAGSDDIIYNDWYYGRRVSNTTSGQYAWCAAFVSWCANECGLLGDVIPRTNNTTNMKNSLINLGGTLHLKGSGYSPVKGDIIFFGNNAGQHVGIVDYSSGNTVYYIDGNNVSTNPHGVHYSSCSLSYSSLYGFVTPAYKNGWTNMGDDFYGQIRNVASGNLVTNREDNVVSGTNKSSLEQLWKFEKQQDGSYKIISCYNGKVLDVYGNGTANQTNIICCDSNDGLNQRWYFSKNGSGYNVVPASATGSTLDCWLNDKSDGANIVLHEIIIGDEAAIFQVDKISSTNNYKAKITSSKFYKEEALTNESYDAVEGGTIYMRLQYENAYGFEVGVTYNNQWIGSTIIYGKNQQDCKYGNLKVGTYQFEFTPKNYLGDGIKITKTVTVKSKNATVTPTKKPTATPTKKPTVTPTKKPTVTPTKKPTVTPTKKPTVTPTKKPTVTPTKKPTITPTKKPTITPTPVPENTEKDHSHSWTVVADDEEGMHKNVCEECGVYVKVKCTYVDMECIFCGDMQQDIVDEEDDQDIKTIKDAEIIFLDKSCTYDGTPKQPEIMVILDDIILEEREDYIVAYKNNINIGKASVIIIGKGQYSGTVVETFQIVIKLGSVVEKGSYKYRITNSKEVAFHGVKNSKCSKVVIPKEVSIGGKKFQVTSVSSKALKNTEVTSVVIGDKVKTIGSSAFEGCSKLTKITIGSSVTKIGSNTFKNCKKLKNITIKSKKLSSVGKNVFKGVKTKIKIKVPSKKVGSYKKLFKNKGQSVEVKK